MGLAIQQAVEAAKKHEVPIGAILVRPDHQSEDASNPVTSFEVLSTSHNQVEYGIDAIAHAEILCFRAAAKTISNWRLVNTTLYTTLEPCITCMAAAYAFRRSILLRIIVLNYNLKAYRLFPFTLIGIDRIVYGAQDFRLGAVTSWVNYDEVIPKHPYHPKGKITVTGGVREEECGKLLKDFFRAIRNQQQPSSIMRRDMSDSLLKQPNRQRMNGFSRIRTMIKTFIGRFFKG